MSIFAKAFSNLELFRLQISFDLSAISYFHLGLPQNCNQSASAAAPIQMSSVAATINIFNNV